MGLNASYLQFIESSIEQTFGTEVRGRRMLELGDQVIDDPGIPDKTGKEYFSRLGYEHVSVDLNGLHGAVVRDLTKPEQFRDWHGAWDILTNAGTTEHVEPFEAQFECFGILHACLRTGGVAIHLLPDVDERDERGSWVDHCRYYYSASFFERLAAACGYELLASTVINGLRCAAVKKTVDQPFMTDRAALLESIAQRTHRPDSFGGLWRRLGAGRLLTRIGLR